MEHWLLDNFLAMGFAFLLTGILIPQILVIAFRKKLFDTQDERKVHKGTVPRLGGLAFVPSIIFSVMLIVGIDLAIGSESMAEAMLGFRVPLYFLICSLMLMFLVGIADDLIGVRYGAKFLFQLVASVLMVCSGVYLGNLEGLFGIWELPTVWVWIITIVGTVYILNAINLIDGIDGLASGLSSIALFFYGATFYFGGNYLSSMLAWATVGAILPFMYFNLFGSAVRRKKIFMGDTGSLSIGMVLAFLGMRMSAFDPASGSGEFGMMLWDFNPLVLAVSPLLVPLFDVARVFYHRIKRGRHPFLPDRTHIHHKFMALGLSQRAALALILCVAIVFLALNVWLSLYWNVNLIFGIDIVVWILGNMWLTAMIRHREMRLGEKLYD